MKSSEILTEEEGYCGNCSHDNTLCCIFSYELNDKKVSLCWSCIESAEEMIANYLADMSDPYS